MFTFRLRTYCFSAFFSDQVQTEGWPPVLEREALRVWEFKMTIYKIKDEE